MQSIRIKGYKRYILIFFQILFILGIGIQATQAKSLYVLADTNDNSAPIQAYDIQGTGLVYQSTVDTNFGWGSVGIAIDTDSKTLFLTQENLGSIKKVDAETFTDLGEVTAPGAQNLAGIVVDQDKGKVYAVDKAMGDFSTTLYVYDLNFNLIDQITLPHGGVGLALDEINDLLYVTNGTSTVRYFDTATWTEQGSFTVGHTGGAVGIAVGATRGYVYAGGYYTGGTQGDTILSKYDINSEEETTLDIDTVVVGLAVDPATGLLYITTL